MAAWAETSGSGLGEADMLKVPPRESGGLDWPYYVVLLPRVTGGVAQELGAVLLFCPFCASGSAGVAYVLAEDPSERTCERVRGCRNLHMG